MESLFNTLQSTNSIYINIKVHGGIPINSLNYNNINSLYNKAHIPSEINYVGDVIYGRFACYNWSETIMNSIPTSINDFFRAFSDFQDSHNVNYSSGISMKDFLKICKEGIRNNKKLISKQLCNESTLDFNHKAITVNVKNKSTHKCIFKNLDENYTTFSYHRKVGGYIPNKNYYVDYDKDNKYHFSIYVIYANGGKYNTEYFSNGIKSQIIGNRIDLSPFQINGNIYSFNTSQLLELLSNEGYQNIYIFDDSCNTLNNYSMQNRLNKNSELTTKIHANLLNKKLEKELFDSSPDVLNLKYKNKASIVKTYIPLNKKTVSYNISLPDGWGEVYGGKKNKMKKTIRKIKRKRIITSNCK
jgi:hypothetical protein